MEHTREEILQALTTGKFTIEEVYIYPTRVHGMDNIVCDIPHDCPHERDKALIISLIIDLGMAASGAARADNKTGVRIHLDAISDSIYLVKSDGRYYISHKITTECEPRQVYWQVVD